MMTQKEELSWAQTILSKSYMMVFPFLFLALWLFLITLKAGTKAIPTWGIAFIPLWVFLGFYAFVIVVATKVDRHPVKISNIYALLFSWGFVCALISAVVLVVYLDHPSRGLPLVSVFIVPLAWATLHTLLYLGHRVRLDMKITKTGMISSTGEMTI